MSSYAREGQRLVWIAVGILILINVGSFGLTLAVGAQSDLGQQFVRLGLTIGLLVGLCKAQRWARGLTAFLCFLATMATGFLAFQAFRGNVPVLAVVMGALTLGYAAVVGILTMSPAVSEFFDKGVPQGVRRKKKKRRKKKLPPPVE